MDIVGSIFASTSFPIDPAETNINNGIDWEGPIPDPEPDSVEVPETTCPFTQEQIHLLPQAENMNYSEGVQAFSEMIALLM